MPPASRNDESALPALGKGAYALVMRLDEARGITIGKLPVHFFSAGFHVYVGSAMNGLDKRIRRHLSSHKKKRWHIDYFLQSARILKIIVWESEERRECELSHLVELAADGIPMKGFGSSDCSCTAHMYFFHKNPIDVLLDRVPVARLYSNP